MPIERDEPRHPIRVVALRTGLSVPTIRAWERRYGVVTPDRSEGGQRLYSDADITRLTLLARATRAGRGISSIANLSDDELRALVREDEVALAGRRRPGSRAPEEADATADIVQRAVRAVKELDGAGIERLLKRAAIEHGVDAFADRVAGPLLHQVGDLWHAGRLTVAHEHIASAAIRRALEWMSYTANGGRRGRAVLVGTPAGERHELGAILAVVAASTEGWTVTYAGPDMPATDLARAADEIGAEVVALSVVYANGDTQSRDEVRALRRLLPRSVTLVVGGEGSAALDGELDDPAVRRVNDLSSFRALLRTLPEAGAQQ